MPRKKRVFWTFAQYNEPASGQDYRVRVEAVSSTGRVALQHLDGDQTGRRIEVNLPLPVRPEGLTAEFCRACDLAVDPKHGAEPEGAVGRVIRAEFGRSSRGASEIVSFMPAEEGSHDPTA